MKDKQSEYKTKSITFKLTETERLELELNAHQSGLTVSKYIRQKLSLNPIKIPHLKETQAYKERTNQIARIGNNLNQIAKWVNTYKAHTDATKICSHLMAIEIYLQELKKE